MGERKASVHELVNDAIKDGVLVRPDRCEDCDDGGTILGHHDDYGKPLDVRWLCYSCHRKWHNENEPLNKDLRDSYTKEGVEDGPPLCELCGHPLAHTPGKVQKTYHRPCRDFKNFLAAAVRAVSDIDPKPTDECIKKIQHEAFMASCRIQARIAKRDSRGRFC